MKRLTATVAIATACTALSFAQAEGRGTLGILGDRSPHVLYSVDTAEPVIALTIDDGPDANTTPQILDLLEEHSAFATFFLISDRVTGNEDLVRRAVAAGHELGNHMASDRKSIDLAPQEFEDELLSAGAVLSEFDEVRWFRPGAGWYDDLMLEIVARHGYRSALGTLYPLDAQIPSSTVARGFILQFAKPGRVIILHDGGARGERTIRTLSKVLPVLAERGYRVVTLSTLVKSAE